MRRITSGNDLPIKTASEVLKDHVPAEILAAALRSILQSYPESSSVCYEGMRPRQAKEASGHYRRNKIDSEFIGIGERFPRLITTEDKMYKHNTGSYVEITCGVVKMTVSCVLTPSDMPREADYRETLAKEPQMLLGFMPEPPLGKYLYAILLHGVDETVPHRAGCRFAQIRFPRAGCKKYFKDRIDLFAMFPEIVAEYNGTATLNEATTTTLPLRVIPKIEEA